LPINEEEWIEQLKRYPEKTKKRIDAERPKNLGQQIALKISAMYTPLIILPKYLRDPETGELLFPDSDSMARFTKLLSKDPILMATMSGAFAELSKAVIDTKEQIKN